MASRGETALGFATGGALVVGAVLWFGAEKNMVQISQEDTGGEYIFFNNDANNYTMSLPLTDRYVIFSDRPFSEADKLYYDPSAGDVLEKVLAQKQAMKAEAVEAVKRANGVTDAETQSAEVKEVQTGFEPYIADTALTPEQIAGMLPELRRLNADFQMFCPEDPAQILYAPEDDTTEAISQDVCINFQATSVLGGIIQAPLVVEPKVGVPEQEILFEERSDYCVWLGDRYIYEVNAQLVRIAKESGDISPSSDPKFNVGVRMNESSASPCDVVAGDAVGLDQLSGNMFVR